MKNLLCCLFPSKNGVEVHHYKKRKAAESFSYSSRSVRKIHRSHAQHSKMFCIMDINMASAWVQIHSVLLGFLTYTKSSKDQTATFNYYAVKQV